MNDKPGYVFKTAKHALQLCLEMDCDKDGILKEEECCFDGMYSRCRDWITLTCWVYHPAFRRLMKIATMEVKSERTEHIALFWKTLNAALQEVTGDPNYKFNPVAFLVDEAGANHCGIEEAFGQDIATSRIITCQSHFFHNMHRRAVHIRDEDMNAQFKNCCVNLTTTTSKKKYGDIMKQLYNIATDIPPVRNFLDW